MSEPAGPLHWRRRMTSSCHVPERAKLHIAMVVFQLGYAGNHVIIRAALNLGVSKFVFPVYRNIIALALLAPFAYFLEKKDRPAMTISLMIQFFFLAAVGITLNQGFYLFGLAYTSPTFASATENAVPAVTFVLATLLGLEQVHFKRRDGVAKVVGTLTSVAGATVITLYKGSTIYDPNVSLPSRLNIGLSLGNVEAGTWILGCIYCFGHCLCWAGWIVLQAIMLRKYPARFSVYSYTCFFGILQFLAVALCFERDLQGWMVQSGVELFSIFYAGLVVSGIGFGIQIWVIQKGGPVFVSGYLPVQTMLVVVLETAVLGEEFYLGGVIGAVLIISGLYLLVWGKSEESKVAAAKNVVPSVSEDNQAEFLGSSSVVQPLLNRSDR